MKNDPSVPAPSPFSQPEKSTSGLEWNNGITRRSFLKRTGGATLASIVTWHGLSQTASASPPPFVKKVHCKLTVTLKWSVLGDKVWLDDAPREENKGDWQVYDSGDRLTPWKVVGPPYPPGTKYDTASGRWYIESPGINMPDVRIEYIRTVIK